MSHELLPHPLEEPRFSPTPDLIEPSSKVYITAISICDHVESHGGTNWTYKEEDPSGTFIQDNMHLIQLLSRLYERSVYLHRRQMTCPYLIHFDADVLDEGGEQILYYSNDSTRQPTYDSGNA